MRTKLNLLNKRKPFFFIITPETTFHNKFTKTKFDKLIPTKNFQLYSAVLQNENFCRWIEIWERERNSITCKEAAKLFVRCRISAGYYYASTMKVKLFVKWYEWNWLKQWSISQKVNYNFISVQPVHYTLMVIPSHPMNWER